MDINQTEACVYLMGRPPISEYIRFIQTQTYESQNVNLNNLAMEWRDANDRVKEIEKVEKGIADNHPLLPIPEKLNYLLEKVYNDEVFKKAFSFMPYHFEMVELDKLMVHQKFINLSHVDRIKKELENNLTEETIFKSCFPFERQPVGFRQQQVNPQAFHFVSQSNDLRFLDTMLLKAEQIKGYTPNGIVAGIVAIVVGFGTNYLSAVSVDNRLILNNGSHRAYALRDLGITYVPCVIQTVTRIEELELFGSNITTMVQQYHNNSRPPLLKDYFDLRLRKVIHLSEKNRHVQVNFNIDNSYLPV